MTDLAKIIHRRELIFLYLIQLLVSVLLLFLPITRYFSYESAVINSFLIFLLTGHIFLNISAREGLSAGAVILIVLPLILIEPTVRLFQSIFSESCSYLHGLKFFLIGVIPVTGVSFFLSQIIILTFARYRYVIFLAVLFVIVVEPIFQFYFLSQVFFYNPVLFFFPGTIYDELLKIDSRLLLHRAIITLGFAGICFLIGKVKSSKLRILIPVVLVVIYYLTVAPFFGFIITKDMLRRNGYTISKTQNFLIYHPVDLSKQLIEELKTFHEFHLAELKDKFEVTVSYQISSYIYKNSFDKGKFFGSEKADIAKPWKKEIHTSLGTVFSTLRHELAHILASEFSNPPFYVAGGFNPWLIEGLAVFSDFSFDDQEIPRLLSAASKISGDETVINQGTLSFFQTNTRYAYLKAGLILNEIHKQYGTAKLKNVYRTGDFRSNLNTTADEIFIEAILSGNRSIALRDSAASVYYFKSKPFILKNCPRFQAEKNAEAVQAIGNHDYALAENILQELLKNNADERYIVAYANLLEETRRYEDLYFFTERLDKEITDINIQLKKIDAKVLSGRNVSEKDYNILLLSSPNLRYDAVLKTRIFFFNKGLLRAYLSGIDSLKKTLILSELYDSTVYLLLPLSNLTSPAEVLEICLTIPKPDTWTEYVKLKAARGAIASGNRTLFKTALELTNSEYLPPGAISDYEQFVRYSNFISTDNFYEDQ
ncbi:MAG: hypothetical protein IT279_01170 [Ignavibacteriaceae bacterium]|nr:hypothetical protein [Ignavibacteriaceae bacterium]